MSWNMCGVVRWGCTGTAAEKVGVVRYHVDRTFVHAALLREVCENDLATLMAELGPGWHRYFVPCLWSQNGPLSPITCTTDRAGTAIVAGFPDVVLGGDFNVKPPQWPGSVTRHTPTTM